MNEGLMWQACPICQGFGVIDLKTCDVCLGKKIIGRNGFPPKENQSTMGLEVPDLKPEEIRKAIMPVFDDSSDEEIQYWATPYYDELQAKKEAAKEQQKIAKDLRE